MEYSNLWILFFVVFWYKSSHSCKRQALHLISRHAWQKEIDGSLSVQLGRLKGVKAKSFHQRRFVVMRHSWLEEAWIVRTYWFRFGLCSPPSWAFESLCRPFPSFPRGVDFVRAGSRLPYRDDRTGIRYFWKMVLEETRSCQCRRRVLVEVGLRFAIFCYFLNIGIK